MIGVVYQVKVAPHAEERLLELLQATRTTRPSAILARLLWRDDDHLNLFAVWTSRDALDDYLATAGAPPTADLLTSLGTPSPPRIVEILDYG